MGFKSSIKDIDRGYDRIRAELKKANGAFVKVGVQSDEKRTEDGGSAAEVAAAHEYGVPDKNIPERSFIRSTIDENKTEINRLLAAEKDSIFNGKSTVERSLGLLGLWTVGKIQKKIRSRISPPLAPATVAARKNKDKSSIVPLIDTGQLIQGLRSVVVMKGQKKIVPHAK